MPISEHGSADNEIRRRRKKAGLTQGELADRVGLSLHGMGRIDRGEVKPRQQTVVFLAAALNCRPADLRGGE
jgi:DNA-binding XRE family transcriptional regulator